MAISSLEELKAENAAAEQEESTPPQAVDSDTEVAAVEEETEELEEGAEPEAAEAEESDTDDWKNPDGHTPEKMFTSRDVKAARIKAADKADRRSSGEIEKLSAEIAELKGRSTKPETLSRPKREQFYESSDPDVAYEDAVLDWVRGTVQAETSANIQGVETVRQRAIQQADRNKAVDDHYERAATLAKDSNIDADVYQQSDKRVREMIESLVPGAGDVIADQLIATLGKGSEKVMFSIGIKETKLNELRNKLLSDPSGMAAALYLGELKTSLTTPRKLKTNAPAPADVISGDATPVNGKASKKDYDALHKKGDVGKAFNIKRAAKKAGVDTSKW